MIGVAGLLAGCGDDPRSAPTPTPTYSCTPDPVGAPCTAELAAAQAEEAKAYEEAIFVYQEFTKERNRLVLAGGSTTPTAEMEKYASGDYLDTVTEFLSSGHSAGRRANGSMEISKLERRSVQADQVSFLACEDARRVEVVDAYGNIVARGQLGAIEVTAQRFSDGWKLVDGANVEVSQCG